MLLYEIYSRSAFVMSSFSECCFHTGVDHFLIAIFALKMFPHFYFNHR